MNAWTKVKKNVDAYLREFGENTHIESFVGGNLTKCGNFEVVGLIPPKGGDFWLSVGLLKEA